MILLLLLSSIAMADEPKPAPKPTPFIDVCKLSSKNPDIQKQFDAAKLKAKCK